jgi:spore germination cell wall hydrolase CwlJ-like protein
MGKKRIWQAVLAFAITLLLVTLIKSCTVTTEAKEKKIEPEAEEQEENKSKKKTEATEGSRPLAGLSLYLQKAAEKNVNILKILLELWQQEQDDIRLLAEVIYHENWYTDKKRKAAYYTGAVVMNRVKSKNWPNTVKEVVYQKRQYAVVPKLFTEKIPDECYRMAKDIYRNGTPDVPANVVYQATFVQGSGDWIDPINGEHFCYE